MAIIIVATSLWTKSQPYAHRPRPVDRAATLNNLALALLLSQRPQNTLPHAQVYYAGNHDETLQPLLRPCR